MSSMLGPIVMRKDVPKSTNFIDNDVGRTMKQETKKARATMENRIESRNSREEQRLKQRISETIHIDVFA